MRAKYKTECCKCGEMIEPGEEITHARTGQYAGKGYYHKTCKGRERERGQDMAETKTEDTKTPDIGAMVEAIVTAAAAGKGDGLTRDDVVAIVRAEVGPRRTVVERLNPEPVDVGTTHKDFDRFLSYQLAATADGKGLYLHGAPGSGKSYLFKQIAAAMSLDYYELTLHPMSLDSRVTGYGDANGNLVTTPLVEAYRNGGFLFLDETDNGNPGVLTALNNALANDTLTVPVLGMIQRHPKFAFGGAGNTVGLGPTRAFPTRQRQDGAFRERFGFAEMSYDEALEHQLAAKYLPTPGEWVSYCHKVRSQLETEAPDVQCSTRAITLGAASLRQSPGQEFCEVAQFAILKGSTNEAAQRIVREVTP